MGWRSKKYFIEYIAQKGCRKKDPFLHSLLPCLPSLILDAGGGDGRWSLGFYELGYEVCLVDFNSHMLRMAKETLMRTRVHIVLSDIRFLPFRPETFDLVFCEADPISQCGSKREAMIAMESLSRSIKKGSMLTGSLSNRYFWVIKMISTARNERELDEVLHLLETGVFKPKKGYRMYLFTPDEFKEESQKAGFQSLTLVPYSGLIASQFLQEKGCSKSPTFLRKVDEIEAKLEKDTQSTYFGRRFRFSIRKAA